MVNLGLIADCRREKRNVRVQINLFRSFCKYNRNSCNRNLKLSVVLVMLVTRLNGL